MLRPVFALAALWCFPILGFAAGDGVWIDVGKDCKSNFGRKPEAGEVYRWIGPCKGGLSDGVGYSTIEHRGERFIWRQTNRDGYMDEAGKGYARYGTAFWHMPSGKNDWQKIWSGDLPAWARTYLLENKDPPRIKQPGDAAAAARQSSDAKLKAAIAKSPITARGGSSEPEWVAVGPYSIDVATLSSAEGYSHVYTAYESSNGRYARVYVTCEPFMWGQNLQQLRPVDYSVEYQVDLVREICRRRTVAANALVTPTYVAPPAPSYQTLLSQGRHAEAFEAAHKAAGAGDAIAMNQVGWALQNGRGIARDPSAAIPWLQRSAQLGNSAAMINLAWAYRDGQGVTRNLNVALDYANQAQAQNHREADGYISSIREQISRQQATAEQEAREREEIREQIARRRREDEEDERRARREADEEREARSRQWMDTAQTLLQGAAAMKRQQDEQNARREAERRRIEADNARYRQAQAEDGRRWAEQNQRMQQAAIERQRVEQERQRVEEARREEARRRPREQRVNLPKYTGCIRLEWGKNIPQNSDQWYTLHNTCANDLHVHWCDRPGCQRPSAMALIRGGGNTRSWLLKKNGVAVTVVAACQLENGGKTVNLDRDGNQCWSMVTMN